MRFRKRKKILPGVYLNFSKSGISTTLGRRGASVNISSRGTYLNTSIPGTGIYGRHKIAGKRRKRQQQELRMNKNKYTAALMALFFGGIGLHRFYLGQYGLGFLYLAFCWTFIPLFLAFIDVLAFVLISRQRFDLKYNTDYL